MREKEMQWFKDHYQQLEKLQGRWIAIEGDTLIAEGDSFDAVCEATSSLTLAPDSNQVN